MEDFESYLLFAEHEALGASWGKNKAEDVYTASYVGLDASAKAQLADLSGALIISISGSSAETFASQVFAAEPLQIGEAKKTALLAGDGRLLSDLELWRLSQDNYLAIDYSTMADSASVWLYSMADLTDQLQQQMYPDLKLEFLEPSEFCLLKLWGEKSEEILADYLTNEDSLPKAGKLKYLMLDGRIMSYVACLADDEAYSLLIYMDGAEILWRSLMSFQDLNPAAAFDYFERKALKEPVWAALNEQMQAQSLTANELLEAGLLRGLDGFIGARSLKESD